MILRKLRRKKRRRRNRRNELRPFMIAAGEFDFMDDLEMHDWMFGYPSEGAQ